jgi:GT2 family glycosyltransferase
VTIHVITVSNKPKYLEECKRSVKAQTRKDVVHHVVRDSDRDWGGMYGPSVYYNEIIKSLPPEDYFCWCSDDDLQAPNFAEDLGGFLDSHPSVGACFGRGDWYIYDTDSGYVSGRIGGYPTVLVDQFDVNHTPYSRLDGGCVLIRKGAIKDMEYPYSPEDPATFHLSDGNWLVRLSRHTPIVRATDNTVYIIRSTPESANWRLRSDKKAIVYTHTGQTIEVVK